MHYGKSILLPYFRADGAIGIKNVAVNRANIILQENAINYCHFDTLQPSF